MLVLLYQTFFGLSAIRTPHDEANAQSCVRFSQECISKTSGEDIMPGMRRNVNAKSAIGYFYRCSLSRIRMSGPKIFRDFTIPRRFSFLRCSMFFRSRFSFGVIAMVIRCYFESGLMIFKICSATPCKIMTPPANSIASHPAAVIDHHVDRLSIHTIKNDCRTRLAMIAAIQRYPRFALSFGFSSTLIPLLSEHITAVVSSSP